ncbi:Transcriptional regulator GlxA family, contains an amidase domain and an AraC-type DNA-binding HTH domain [Chryseolinea serpens]|uniref:Transcriptional regulator GlxA family, contains an amidase domain and an AraC-type DNA-binding HTH domain n=1 Tax=Chryseolinea serpens TaxID=947013 RepID=A0A1M5TQA8_9BACT|nr:Transcriptional regulator GlxA family, contains an amidase domain and an AraC-type DNA-binding HTH domain [Chryseolinea serpens]
MSSTKIARPRGRERKKGANFRGIPDKDLNSLDTLAPMKRIGLLLPYDYQLFSVATILDVLGTANRICERQKKQVPFVVTVVQLPEQILQQGSDFHGHPVKSIHARTSYDIVLIPAFSLHDKATTMQKNRAYVPWLQKQFKTGAEIASFCTGANLFAATGLLNGKLATTHMDACPDLIIDYPSVYVKPGRTITIDERCYTSGGATSSFHLLIFLIQKYGGNELAVRISKIFCIDLNRSQQSYFSTFRPDYSHSDELVKKIQRNMEENYLHITTVEEITKDLPASRRNIVRRFKQATGVPPIEYLQHIRIEKAKRQLELSNLNISEIINETGYTDPKSFRKIFVKLVGMTASEYRNKLGIK